MRWLMEIDDYDIIITPSVPFGPTNKAVWNPTTISMHWNTTVALVGGTYKFQLLVEPFPTGPGLQLTFTTNAIFPATGDSEIVCRWMPGMPDLGLPFLSTSLIQISETHTPPLTGTLFYNLHPCDYVHEPP